MKYKINIPPLRKLIDYLQEKQANVYLGNLFCDMVAEDSKEITNRLHDPDNKDQTGTLAYLAALGGAYQKNLHLFVRPKEPSRLQKIIFPVINRLDKIIAA